MRNKLRSIAWLLVPAMLCLQGCAAIGWMVNAFAPPKKVDAIFKLPEGKKVLVFVDDLLRPVDYEPVKAELTEGINRQLEAHDLAKETIAYEDLLTLMAATPEFNELAVSEIGERLGADIVLYVEIDEFALKDDEVSPLWHGRLAAGVRVVDAKDATPGSDDDAMGARLWPDDRAGGYPVRPVEIPAHAASSDGHGAQLSQTLAAVMADRVAKLFYKHEITAREAAELEKEAASSQ